jgi:membrane associated rhomboid family serine protease
VFIPYEVDAPFDRQPVANWLVLGGIILLFILQLATSEKPKKIIADRPIEEVIIAPTVEEETVAKQEEKRPAITGPMARFVLNGWGIGLFTYIWLHGGVFKGVVRVIGNVIFLWPFGNAICSKIGNKLYLLVYLGFGFLAGVMHLILTNRVAVGASGAISGIVGMYIVLFPENSISCLFLLPRPMAVGISGLWVVLLWFIFDILEAGASGQSTIYYAHILFIGAGAGLAVLMLKKNWLVMDKDEKTLLQVLSKLKEEEQEIKESEKTAKMEYPQGKGLEAVEKPLQISDKTKTGPAPVMGERSGVHIAADTSQRKAVTELVKPDDDYIRFKCECGHRIKVHKKDAGKTGRCPKCSRWLEAPRK